MCTYILFQIHRLLVVTLGLLLATMGQVLKILGALAKTFLIMSVDMLVVSHIGIRHAAKFVVFLPHIQFGIATFSNQQVNFN